jgi:raffinose/stachyose/melibiose transport system substrate-binding protein
MFSATSAMLLLGVSGVAQAAGLTLTVWHNTSDTPAVLDLYKAYEKASGNKINLVDIPADGFETATLTKWASGDRPDIVEYEPGLSTIDVFNPAQTMLDLSDEEFVKRSDIYSISGRASDGKVYAAITTFPETWGLYYNKKVLADHGLKPAITFDELKSQCSALSKAGVTTLHQAGSSAWPVAVQPMIYATTLAKPDWVSQLLKRKVKFGDPDSPYLQGLKNWVELKDAGCYNADMTTATFEQSAKAVFEGKAAYELIHSNMVNVYFDEAGGDTAKLDATVGFGAIGAKEQKTVIDAGPVGSFLAPRTGNDAQQAAALDFLRFVTGSGYSDYVKESGTFPIVHGVPDPANVSRLLKDVKAAYDKGPLVTLMNQGVPGGMLDGIQAVNEMAVGQRTPQETADQLQRGLEAAARAQGLAGW